MKRIYFYLLVFLLPAFHHAQEVSTHMTISGAGLEQITWAADGRIFVVDYTGNKVYRIISSGQIKTIGNFSGPLGGSMDQEGNFYFSEFYGSKVYKVKPDDSYEVYATGFIGPSGILVDTSQSIMYVANYSGNSIYKINMLSSNPTPAPWAHGGGINGPDGLAFAPNGDIIAANFNNNNIQRISPDGSVSRFTTVTGSLNTGYIVKGKNGYFTTGIRGNAVFHIDWDGQVSRFAGTGINGRTDGPVDQAQFSSPNGIAISPDLDSLLVSEGPLLRLITPLETTTSVQQHPIIQQLKVMPNPASTYIDIQLSTEEPTSIQLQLINTKGAIIDTILYHRKLTNSTTHRYDLPDQLTTGQYFIRLEVDGQIASFPFIKL